MTFTLLLLMTFTFSIFLLFVSMVKGSADWDYLHQQKWAVNYPNCGGRHQSPIDLEDVCLPGSNTKVNTSLQVTLINYGPSSDLSYSFTNNGHTAELVLSHGDTHLPSAPQITGSAVDGQVYQFTQLHFHWDQNDTKGSEHSFHGERRALEMHLVHWNTKYNNFAQASTKSDGLLVFGVLFHADVHENPLLDPIIDLLPDIVLFGHKMHLEEKEFNLNSLLPVSYQTFYKYKGSLTTPPCYESVTWLVVAELENIGYSQLFEFAKLDNRENRLIGNTNRLLQDLNGRSVEASSNRHCFRQKSGHRTAKSSPLDGQVYHSPYTLTKLIDLVLSWL